jgi:hypothetical protein
MGYYNLFDYVNCKHFRFAQRVIDSRINTKVHCYINDPGCVCGWVIEDAIHFFLQCCLYVEAREQLTNNLQFLFVGVIQQWRKCSQKKIVKLNILVKLTPFMVARNENKDLYMY